MSYEPDSKVRWIVIHYSATPIERSFTAADINRMHLERGFREIGYHYFLRRDGTVEVGRDLSQPGRFETGAHSLGENSQSVGICYEGGVTLDDMNTGRDTRTPAQTAALIQLLRDLKRRFPNAVIEGHRDMPGASTECPGFDAASWWASVALGSPTGPGKPNDAPKPEVDDAKRLRWRLAEIRDRARDALNGL